MVADAAKATPPVLVQTTDRVPLVVQSPDRSPLVMVAAPEKAVRLPLTGEPVVETVPPPPVTAVMTPPEMVMVDPSGFTAPKAPVVASGRRAAGNVPEVMLVALVASVEQLGAAFDRSAQAAWP